MEKNVKKKSSGSYSYGMGLSDIFSEATIICLDSAEKLVLNMSEKQKMMPNRQTFYPSHCWNLLIRWRL
jgi:hypothetical protein